MMTLNLAGKWNLTSVKTGDTVPAQVPGDTHSALLAAKKIEDPYWGSKELDVQWVGREDWCYSRSFTVSKDMLAEKSVFLNCDCLDTFTEIRINGKKVGATANMFVRYRFEVKPFLKEGLNTIAILFHSAESVAVATGRKLPYPIPYSTNPVQSPNRNLVRKVQCHSGWDWGPCLMVAGIYGDISLGATSVGRIEYVYSDQKHDKGACSVTVNCEFLAVTTATTTMTVTLGVVQRTQTVRVVPGLNVLKATVVVKNPKLWWPNGHGEQPLYPLTVRVGDAEFARQLGLRKIEVINEEDKVGLSLVFRVNGVDIFCKGANWIPCDALPERQTRAALEELLSSAVKSHMNMVRVWGGGQYESDAFYQLCDEKGILIWQDFMFACALYPATPAFLDLVKHEAVHQIKRLRDHPCIALWCGNNENVGFLNWFQESRADRDRYLVDYDRLNEGVLGNTARELDPSRKFWPSSPCGGPGDYSDAFQKDNRGDMHYWGVWHEGKSLDEFHKIIPRFCSEFGYQSFPSLDAIRSFAPAEQFNVTSPVMEHHQRNVGGNSKIIEMFSRNFRMPDGFENFVYLSQVQQALAIKTAVEHWRHLRPVCMGTIYWQLNNNWPVCSWASLDYQGKWKLLHYAARRFYAPSIVSAFQRKDEKVEIWVTDDQLKARKASVTVQVVSLAGKVLFEDKLLVQMPRGGAKLLREYPLSKLTDKPESSFLMLSLDADGQLFRNEHFFCAWKKCDLAQANVKAVVKAAKPGMAVTVSTDRPAFYVSLNMDGIKGEFDDNCITLLPRQARTLMFTPKQPVAVAAVQKALVVRHLRMTYK